MPSYYISLPYVFVKFWFVEAPISLIRYFFSLNHAALEFLSIPLMIRTFFKPIKNEYRKGLVWFSIGMGMFIKTFLILIGIKIFTWLVILEALIVILFVAWPIIAIFSLFI